jgi:hypothetical protein
VAKKGLVVWVEGQYRVQNERRRVCFEVKSVAVDDGGCDDDKFLGGRMRERERERARR